MSKIKLLTIAVIGLLLVNAGILAFLFLRNPAPPPQSPGPMSDRERPKRIIIERLHFDNEQVAQYEMLVDAHRKTIQKLDEQIRETKNNLYATLTSSSFNKDSLQIRLGEIQKQIESIHYNHFADIKKICRPDQLEEFNALTKELARFFAPGKNQPHGRE